MSNMGGGTYTHRKAEGETTEWDDILKKKGITQPTQAELDKAAAEEIRKAVEEAVDNTDLLALKSVSELNELEEEGGEFEDSRTLEAYRDARIAEMKAAAKRNRFGMVLPLVRVDFVKEVNEASADGTWVVIHMHQEHVDDSVLLGRALAVLAGKKKDVKFLVSKADACIEGYPDKNVPTLLLYRDGALQSQIVTLAELGGKKLSVKILEWVLHKKGVCDTELEDDPREEALKPRVFGGGVGGRSLKSGGGGTYGRGNDDEDEDE